MRYVKWSPVQKQEYAARQWVWSKASQLQADEGLTRAQALSQARYMYNHRGERKPVGNKRTRLAILNAKWQAFIAKRKPNA